VPFALERSLAVESERKYDQEGARLHRIEAGALFIERDSVSKTVYRIKNGAAEHAQLLVRHPRQPGSRLHEPPPGTEDNTGARTALVPVDVKGHGRAELLVDERSSMQQHADWLSPLADEAVKAYLQHPRGDTQQQPRLAEAWKVRAILVRAADEQQKLEAEQRELENAASETRLSIKAIEKNAQAADLRQKLTKRLGELMTRMDQVTKRLIEVRMTVNEQQVRFRDAIREIKILKAPGPTDPARGQPNAAG
jgi:predicted transcriptional regulator